MTTNTHILTINDRLCTIRHIVRAMPDGVEKQTMMALLDDALDQLMEANTDMSNAARKAKMLSDQLSTISRAIANKYLMTPYGLYPYSFFFSTGYRSSDGEDVAAGAIKQKLAALIESEPPAKPYSDQKLADMLAEQGLNVARRTVAKYREAMNILPASNRKVFN